MIKDERGLPLLIENYVFKPLKAELVEGKNGGSDVIIEGEFGVVDKLNGNKRIYPRMIMEREIKEFGKKPKGALGELDHPEDGKTKLHRSSHVVEKLWLTEDGKIMGRARVIGTSRGRDLVALYESGAPVGISSRGFGTTISDVKGNKIVQPDFKLKTFDFVEDPSAGVYPEIKNEDVDMKHQESIKFITESNEDKDNLLSLFGNYGVKTLEKLDEGFQKIELDNLEGFVKDLEESGIGYVIAENTGEENIEEAVIDKKGKDVDVDADSEKKDDGKKGSSEESDDKGNIPGTSVPSKDTERKEAESTERSQADSAGDQAKDMDSEVKKKESGNKEEAKEDEVCEECGKSHMGEACEKSEEVVGEEEEEASDKEMKETKEEIEAGIKKMAELREEIQTMINENHGSVALGKIKDLVLPLVSGDEVANRFTELQEQNAELEKQVRDASEEKKQHEIQNSRLEEALDRTVRRLLIEQAYTELGTHNVEAFEKALSPDRETISVKELKENIAEAMTKVKDNEEFLDTNDLISTLNIMSEKGADLQEEISEMQESHAQLTEEINLHRTTSNMKALLEERGLLEGYKNKDEIITECAKKHLEGKDKHSLLTEDVKKVDAVFTLEEAKEIISNKGVASSPEHLYDKKEGMLSRIRDKVTDTNLREQLDESRGNEGGEIAVVGQSVSDYKKLSGTI